MKKIISLALALTLTAPGLFPGCRDIHHSASGDLLFPPEVIRPATVEEVRTLFGELDYSWDEFDQGVPNVIVERLPQDLANASSTAERKQLFFMLLLPMVLQANEEILMKRNTLISLFDSLEKGRKLRFSESEKLRAIAARYKIKGDPVTDPNVREQMLIRVDAIPLSLVLAQAANESAYGTSRFALKANNLFGQWTFTRGAGLVPADRPADANHEVRTFPTLLDSIRSYLRNINTHGAYRKLRSLRAMLRRADEQVLGNELAAGLDLYSARGEEYVEEIRAMIRVNGLDRFADLTLRVPEGLRRYSRPGVQIELALNP